MIKIDIVNEITKNFINSSYDVNNNRAFPDIRDGLKPGMRACLWEMYTKKYNSSKPHVKSAKISGGVAALWWPHGTAAIYETFARMSMPYINNVPEVDFHGSNGNQILGNDSIAADRYTEARLSKITEDGMLAGINKNNVDMLLNFSEDEEWPKVLPAVFPRLLVNGAQGIGVSIANHWTLHNFTETANLISHYLKTNELKSEEYYPDFPTGGTIINKDDLPEINKTGKGKILLEASYKIDGDEIEFYEMPYQVYIEPVIEQIKDAIEKEKLSGIKEVVNKSDKKRLSLVVVCSLDPAIVLERLFSETDLRKQYNVNQVGMVGKTPRLRNLKETIDIYVDHNLNCIKREHQYDYDAAIARIHILEGLIIAINNIDKVIFIIRNSGSPREELMKTFSLDEKQVDAILNMKLAKLSKLEIDKLLQEKESKEGLAEYCKNVIESEDTQKSVLSARLSNLVSKYGDSRRTKVIQKTVKKVAGKAKTAKEILPEPVVVTVNSDGYIKSIPVKNFRNKKNTDIFYGKTDTTDVVILYSSLGKCYRLPVKSIKQCLPTDKGTALGSILRMQNNEKILAVDFSTNGCGSNYVLFVTRHGVIKKTDPYEYRMQTQNIKGINAINLKNDDEVVSISFGDDNSYINIYSVQNYIISFAAIDVNYQGKIAAGVKGMALSDNDTVQNVVLSEKPLNTPQKRGGKGKKLLK